MSACVLHVGMMKTGTSSIQKSFSGFADATFVYYEDRNGRTNHTPAIFGIVGAVKPGKDRQKIPEGDAREAFDEAIRSLGERSLLVSGEGMLRLSSNQIQEVGGYFRARGVRKLTIVAYVRSPVGYVTSLARATKGGALTSLQLDTPLRYRESFGKFDQALGRENVLLWKFEPQSFPSGCVVQDFCSRLGIDLPSERIVRENESLSREAVSLLYTYHRFGVDLGSRSMRPVHQYQLTQRLAAIGQTKFRFSPDLVRPFLERNRADIEWMEQRLGQSLDEDWREHRPDDVSKEEDLLHPDPEVVEEVRRMLGDAAPAGVKGETSEEVALLVHALRDEPRSKPARKLIGRRMPTRKLAPRVPVMRDGAESDSGDLIAQIERTRPELLNGISKEQAQRMMSSVFRHIQDKLAQTKQGTVSYARLGSFRVKKIEKDRNGTKASHTRIRFVPTSDRTTT